MKRTVTEKGRILEYTLLPTTGKSVLIKLLPGGTVRVYAPKNARLKAVDAIVIENADRIRQGLKELAEQERERGNGAGIKNGSQIPVAGKMRSLSLHPCAGKRAPKPVLEEDALHIWVQDTEDADAAASAVKAELVRLALNRITERLQYYRPRIGGTYNRVAIRSQRTRWGSCSSRQNLNFNWRLIMAPPEALDYVVIHELCHLHEMNHSARFWKLVEQQMPEYRVWRKWLRDNGRALFACLA